MSKTAIENVHGFKIKQMDYNSIVAAIPREWKKLVMDKPVKNDSVMTKENMILLGGQWSPLAKATCKDFYKEFVIREKQIPKAQLKWNNNYTNDLEWPEIYKLPYLTTRDTALQSFQYKILHRFFPCNYTLSIWYGDQSPTCSNCENEDNLEHYFFLCSTIQQFWTGIEKWWLQALHSSVSLNPCHVLFGLVNPGEDIVINIFNLCILYGKWHIFKCKQNGSNPSLYDYLRMLKNVLDAEIVFYTLQGKKAVFEEKWSLLYQEL